MRARVNAHPDTLFRRLLGAGYGSLPEQVRRFHDADLPASFAGQASVRAARGWLARLAARVAGLPRRDGMVTLRVTVRGHAGSERWQRDFAGETMTTTLIEGDGRLLEWLGLVRFRYRLDAGADALVWTVDQARVFGLPVPAVWFAGVRAREYQRGDRYGFAVAARLPLIGHVVAYDGWLSLLDERCQGGPA